MTLTTTATLAHVAQHDRILLEAALHPAQGTRFQPTGFPDLGAATFRSPSGRDMLLVESEQSMANRLEAVCWDEAAGDVAEPLRGMPYVAIYCDGMLVTTSLQEAHRLNSPYLMEADNGRLKAELIKRLEVKEAHPVDVARLARTAFYFDPNSVLHGVFLVSPDIAGGRYRLSRLLSAFIEASDAVPVELGGVKFDRVDPTGDATKGFGHVPFHRTEFAAASITAYFCLDIDRLRAYRLGLGQREPAVRNQPATLTAPEEFLVTLAFWKIRRFLESGLRLRTYARAHRQHTGSGRLMVTVALTFTAGRYSATPWGHHVNEGLVEWPPSPWRLLRALAAVWKNTLPDLSDETVKAVLGRLAAPPRFALPPATTTHTRHYMPGAGKDRSLVFDTSIIVDRRAQVRVQWPEAELTADERALLSTMLRRLPYLGRAESWCVAELCDVPDGSLASNSYPLAAGQGPTLDEDVVEVLTAVSPLDLSALLVNTADLRRAGHDPRTPPGARWQRYTRPRSCFQPQAVSRQAPTGEQVTVARYRLVGPVLPTLLRTVDVAEAARRALMGIYGRQNGDDVSRTFSGKATDGAVLTGHQHAAYIPADEDLDGHIDHLIVFARGGFNRQEQRVLGSLQTLRVGREVELQLALTYLGDDRALIQLPLLGCSRTWASLTPFVLPRHPKFYANGKPRLRPDGTQIDGPEDQLRRELALRGLPGPTSIARLPRCTIGVRQLSWQDFQRWRSRGGSPAEAMGFGFALSFDNGLSGPLLLGYGCHFGLGVFVPAGRVEVHAVQAV